MAPSLHRDAPSGGLPVTLVREASAVALAVVVFLATFRLVRSPLLAVPLAGLAYWGVRTWIDHVSTPEVGTVGDHAARLRYLEEELTTSKGGDPSTTQNASARLLRLADELDRLDRRLAARPKEVVEAEFFVEVQLPQALVLAETYARLAASEPLGDRARDELQAAAESLDRLHRAIEEQHRRLVEQDLREFAVDRRVFDELLRLDGPAASGPDAAGESGAGLRARDAAAES